MSEDMTPEDLDRLFALNRSLTNLTPTPEQVVRIERLREHAKRLGALIIVDIIDSRERSLALTHLEETVMWAVKSIVLEEEL